MDATRRASIQAIGAASLAALTGNIAYAQTARKLTILIGFPAGGAPDTVARAMSVALRDAGYTVVIDNKAGAGGRLAADVLMQAPADGSTIMLVPAGNMTIYPHIYNKLKYDWQKDFALLATACEFQFGMAVGPAVPARTLKEFVDWARANPGKASFGTPGAGTGMHFLGVMFGRDARIDFNHIPYKGGAPALTDAMGGNIPAVFTTLPNLVQPHKDGRIRILGFSGDSRLKGLPDVPTFKESGFPDLSLSEMFVFVARAETPAAVQRDLAMALSAAVRTRSVNEVLEKTEYDPLVMEPPAIARRLQAEQLRWGAVVRSTGYKSEE
jgi:tripartite-type tricarboxylate transporter receptor subunit TctC